MNKHKDDFSEEEETRVVPKSYDEVATESPELEDDIDDEGNSEFLSMSRAADAASDLTDMQAAMEKLYPSIGSPELRAMMVSRVSPEMFLPLLHDITMDEVMRSNPEEELDQGAIQNRCYTGLSIGLDGMGRIDIAELQGAARDTRLAEKAGLGF